MKTYHHIRPLNHKRHNFTTCCEKDLRNLPRGDSCVYSWEEVPAYSQICGGPAAWQVQTYNKLSEESA